MPPNIASPGFAYPASRVTPNTLDWPVIGTDPNDDWWREASSISNRSWHLYRTNPYARALVVTMLEGVLGPSGLLARSIYRADLGLEITDGKPNAQGVPPGVQAKRVQIEQSLRQAFYGTR